MTSLQFPSHETPAPPAFALDVPDEWSRVVTPAAIVSAVAPNVDGEFRSNVIVTWARYGEPVTLQAASEAVLDGYTRRQGEFIGVGEQDFDGTPAWLCEVAFAHPDGGTIVQANSVVVLQRGDVCDVLHVVASCGADRVDGQFETIRSVARSLSLTG